MSPRRGLVVMLGLALSAAALSVAPSATASGDETGRGDCDGSSDVRLRLIDDDSGRLDVTGSILSGDDNFWSWKMRHDDDVSAKGETRLRADDRALRIERTMIDAFGQDDIVFRAEDQTTGEVCRVEIDY